MHDIINILRNDSSYHPRNFQVEIPEYHPDSNDYKMWWRDNIKKCVEGFWYEGRFMPPQLYNYANFGIIERIEDENSTSQKTVQPLLRDTEWLFFYNWLICRKFSGFELDDKLTSNRKILDPKFKIESASPFLFKNNGKLKEYVDPRDYLYMKHERSLGKPIYENNALNMIMLTSRGTGKLLLPNANIRVHNGWKKMKDIKIGDKVYGSDGKLCNVTNKTELQKNVDIYEITFENNFTIKCCKDHLWLVYNSNGRQEIYTTIKLLEKIKTQNYYIPVPNQLEEIEDKNPIRKITAIGNLNEIDYYGSRGCYIHKNEYYIKVNNNKKKIRIDDIQFHSKGEGYCISVDSSNNTYITDNYIVTHNSYWGAAVSLHEFILNSAISFEQLLSEVKSPTKTKVNCIITCELEDKANDLMNKIKTWYELMPGSHGDDDEYTPSPLYRAYTGSWANKITQQIERYYHTKDGTKSKKIDGSGSTISIVTFNKDAYKTAGKRNSVTIIEEIGLCNTLLTFWGANKDVQRVGKVKFGSTLGMGCVCAGTKVWTNNGRLVNIEDLKQEDGIIGYDGKKVAKQTINWFKEPAIKPCYRITTEGNNIIECSEDHPFIFSSKATRGWFKGKPNTLKGSYKEAKNLSVGDYLIVINDVPVFGDVIQDNAYLIGLMLGDGYFKGKSLSVDDDSIKSYVESNYSTSVRKQFTTQAGNTYTDLYIKGRRKDLFHESLINLTRHEKRLPSNIHEYSKESLSLILAGIFDADGNVNVSTKGTRVVLTNISENLLKDVKYQLLKFGVHCSIYKENRNIKPDPGYEGQLNHIFRLYISRDLDVKKFKDNIPIKHSRKIESLSKFIHGKRDIGTAKIAFKHTGECEDEKYLQHDELLEGYKIQRIKSIEFIGNKEIYNLNVSDNHNYICGSFITGNTGGDLERVQASKRIFENPTIYDCLAFDDTFENSGKKIGLFIPAYLGNNDFKDERGLTKIEEAFEYYEDERKALIANNASSRDLDDEIMNRPLYPSEMFLNKKGNVFPVAELKQCLLNLISNPKRLNAGNKGMLKRDTNDKRGVKFENDISQVYNYIDMHPLPKDYKSDKNYLKGCVRIWEHPLEGSPHGLYKIGYDTVHYDFVDNPESLISVLVYKGNTRFLSAGDNVYYDTIVAEYTGRFDLLDKNNEIVEMISKYYYNAEIMMEVNIAVNIEYFKRRGILHLLATQPTELLDKHVKNRQSNNIVGYIKSPELVSFLEQSTKEWLEKERGMDSEGKMIRNMDMINSKPLLEELISYNREDNFDRINALFALMLAYKQENLDIEEDYYLSDNKFLKSMKDLMPKKKNSFAH